MEPIPFDVFRVPSIFLPICSWHSGVVELWFTFPLYTILKNNPLEANSKNSSVCSICPQKVRSHCTFSEEVLLHFVNSHRHWDPSSSSHSQCSSCSQEWSAGKRRSSHPNSIKVPQCFQRLPLAKQIWMTWIWLWLLRKLIQRPRFSLVEFQSLN